MNLKIFHGERGSALAMVIVLITILSTLGLAMMTLGIAHYKVSKIEQKAKISFYLAESGLEQAYKIMMEEVAQATKAGNEAINSIIKETLHNEVLCKLENGDCPTDYVKEYYYNGEEYVILEIYLDKIQRDIENNNWGSHDLQMVFETNYKNHFNITLGGKNRLLTRLEDPMEYIAPDGKEENRPRIKVVAPTTSPLFPSNSKKISLTLCSTYGVLDDKPEVEKIPQKVQMDFTIKMPSEEEILKENYYYIYRNVIETNRDSELWHNALVAYGDIQIYASDVKINGKVFAKGTSDGGFVLCGNGETVEVNSNLISANSVKISAETKNNILNVNGNIYADNVIIDHETKNNEIKIKGDVYTKDDLVLNGEKSRLKIEGNYYGFSDGALSSKHDESSGIIINAMDISTEDGSELKIFGEEMFVNGVSYIDVVDNKGYPYSTGESVSIKGNYRVYGSYFLDDDYYYYYNYYAPLTLVEERLNKSTNVRQKMNVFRKAEYFWNFGEKAEIPTWLNKGTNIVLPEPAKIYSTGAFITNNKIYKNGGLYTYGEAQGKIEECSSLYYQNLLGEYSEYVHIKDFDQSSSLEVICFSSNKNIYLVGPGGDQNVPSNNILKNVDANVNGIIVSEGDVYLRGMLNFKGTIITNGNIFIEDSYPKSFTNSWFYIFEKINREVAEEDDPFVYSDEYINRTIESSLEVTEPTNIVAYKQYISIDNWEKL